MTVPAHVFREYDIRGIVGQDLTRELVHAVGRAYGTVLIMSKEPGGVDGRAPVVVVGHDNRPSSPELAEALISGILSTGVDVLGVGTVPTPVAYWAEKMVGSDGALQVTGSHNPPEWNGIKMTLRGDSFYGDDVRALRGRILQGDFASGHGKRTDTLVLDRYVDDLARRFRLAGPVKVVVDCGNGAGSVVAVRLLERLGAEVVPLYCESDGTFPNHHPDPSVEENLRELIRQVGLTGAALGVAFDGDADRLGAVDDKGRIIRGDVLLLLFGLDLLERRGPGQLLIYDVKCSQLLPEVYEAAGGKGLMWKTGHSLMKEKMKETGAPLAGELSGHVMFADDYIGTDDALYGACRLLEMVARSERPLSARVDALPVYCSTPEVRIEVSEESKVGIVSAAVEHFRRRYEVITVDGARILFPEGWALLRASNTQPILVARFEARDPVRLCEIRGEVEAWLAAQGVHV
ncbi:MAG: phosphomannomutase/phosphoglucomutase [Gemmatimonadetes bacterium]|nr:phosphomannomutase/phosphoglucomutase [Gemmatimonadota bacterium]